MGGGKLCREQETVVFWLVDRREMSLIPEVCLNFR
jgi:hypothetical protein